MLPSQQQKIEEDARSIAEGPSRQMVLVFVVVGFVWLFGSFFLWFKVY